MDAPTADELQAHPAVQAAFAAAWADSFADDPELRHEEGGWVYLDPSNGSVTVRRAAPGMQDLIDLSAPPTVTGSYVVAMFHTHPNPTADGWNPGPSLADRHTADAVGVPSLIVSDQGMYHAGPDRRRGGLTGLAGYPY